ncbi:hypothetical protein QJQ45_010995 [Haematococcus lacustris]|nr:hypothetical protein QJQ45_010995 [Haematococcus lacustris]
MDKSSANGASTGQQLQGLQGLPAELLGAVLRQLDASSRLQVFRTSKLLATAVLRISPSIQLTYPTQHDIQRDNLRKLAPFLAEVLRNRQLPQLHLTLQLAYDLDEAILPLVTSFPSLTSLTFKHGRMSIGNLAQAIRHPLLLPRLLHLDLQGIITAHGGDQLHMSPFIGSRLQRLSLGGWVQVDGESEFLSGLVDEVFPPHLTQLEVTYSLGLDIVGWVKLAAAVRSLTQLQQLSLTDECHTGPGLTALLLALAHLPSLHTLVVDDYVEGQQQLHALLALTQITRLEVYGFRGLTSSQAGAACSWRQLKVWRLDWVSAAYLPLHSLTYPLWLRQLVTDIGEPSREELAAAELNLCEYNKAGLVLDRGMVLKKATVDLLVEQYLSHSRRTAHQPPHPTVASSSHSGHSTSLASSSSPEGHITPGGLGSSSGRGGQQGVSTAGVQALMQRLGRDVEVLHIVVQEKGTPHMSLADQEALPVLFPGADIRSRSCSSSIISISGSGYSGNTGSNDSSGSSCSSSRGSSSGGSSSSSSRGSSSSGGSSGSRGNNGNTGSSRSCSSSNSTRSCSGSGYSGNTGSSDNTGSCSSVAAAAAVRAAAAATAGATTATLAAAEAAAASATTAASGKTRPEQGGGIGNEMAEARMAAQVVQAAQAVQPLDLLVSLSQSAFILGRDISDNVQFHLSLLEYLQQRGSPAWLLLLDLAGAYDNVSWGLLQDTMEAMGFRRDGHVRWAQLLHRGASSQVLVNGRLTDSFPLTSGLLQGSGASPLYWCIALQPLVSYLSSLQLAGLINTPTIPHSPLSMCQPTLLPVLPSKEYADDLTIAVLDRVRDGAVVLEALGLFRAAGGPALSVAKSSALSCTRAN